MWKFFFTCFQLEFAPYVQVPGLFLGLAVHHDVQPFLQKEKKKHMYLIYEC